MTHLRQFTVVATMVLVGLTAVNGHAQNVSFLRNSLLADLSATEIDTLLDTARRALDTLTAGNSKLTWQSEDGKINGTLHVLEGYVRNDQHCRQLHLASVTVSQTSSRIYGFCKSDNGWQLDAR